MIDMVNALPFKNYCYQQGKTWSEEKIEIEGVFKEEDGNVIKDNFTAHKVLGCSVEEIYKLYLSWFNYTLRPYEKKRFFVSAKEGEPNDGS